MLYSLMQGPVGVHTPITARRTKQESILNRLLDLRLFSSVLRSSASIRVDSYDYYSAVLVAYTVFELSQDPEKCTTASIAYIATLGRLRDLYMVIPQISVLPFYGLTMRVKSDIFKAVQDY